MLNAYVQQQTNVRVVEAVEHLPPGPPIADDSGGAQEPERVRHGRLGHLDDRCEVTDAQLALMHQQGKVVSRTELVERSRELAARLGFTQMSFLNLSVAQATTSSELPARIDMVTALHACDTATDDAIAFGLSRRARFMVLVPCCQAEIARALNQNKAMSLSRTPLAELWRHPLHTREMGSQITNVLRCLYLEACGYQVTVTELVGWEHSLKNELIIARDTGHPKPAAARRLRSLLDEFALGGLLEARFPLPPPDPSGASPDESAHGLA